MGSSLAALSAGEDGEALGHTKVGVGVEVRASTVSLRSSGGAEEGDEAEDGVWGVLRADVWCGRMCCCNWGGRWRRHLEWRCESEGDEGGLQWRQR